MERDSSVESAVASIIERLDRDPSTDLEKLLERYPEHAGEIRARVERLRQAGLLRARPDPALTDIRARFEQPDEPSAGISSDPEPRLPSQVLGSRYRITAEIGRGGMGRVFRAVDLDMEREVALKIVELPAQAADRDSRRARLLERFIQEARLTANLEHPSIVPLHDVGIDRTGQLYYTMKLIQGRSLESLFSDWHREDRRSIPLDQLLRILLRASEAVALAHSKGVIHRDLKPANIMLGDFGEVYVLDWGLAKSLHARGDQTGKGTDLRHVAAKDSPTLAGDILGTPRYMAPEQRDGNKNVDRRADVYGLGAILHHGLFGEPPDITSSRSFLRAPKDALAPEVHAICDRALQNSPQMRYESASELADDIRAALEGRVVRAYRTGAWAELSKWMSRNRRTAISGGIALLIAVSALVSLVWMQGQIDQSQFYTRRLSAALTLDDLEREADSLWPAIPSLIPAYEDWIGRATALALELPGHRIALDSINNTNDPFIRQVQALISGLEQLQSGMLASDGFVPKRGSSIPRRLSLAREIKDGFGPGGAYDRLWRESLPAIQEAYPGLDLPIQQGLVPIGRDAHSGLWEFGVLGTGEMPTRAPDGGIVVTPQMALVMVLLPGGQFMMGAQSYDPTGPNYDPTGATYEHPPHLVTVSPFFISKYEMTQGQWRRLTGDNPSYYQGTQWVPGTRNIEESNPVEKITWEEALRTCRNAGLDLPSEAQWEYAARAGTTTIWWTGDDPRDLARAGNIADLGWLRGGGYPPNEEWDDGQSVPCTIGLYLANPFGLHDVVGNVSEWCLDHCEQLYYYQSADKDPVNVLSTTDIRVHRGGLCLSMSTKARSATRSMSVYNTVGTGAIGVRPALAITEQPIRTEPNEPDSTPKALDCDQFFTHAGRDPHAVEFLKSSATLTESFDGFRRLEAVDRLQIGTVAIDIDLMGPDGEVVANHASAQVDPAFTMPGSIEKTALRSILGNGTSGGIRLLFTPPIQQVSFWIYDEFNPLHEVHPEEFVRYSDLDEHSDKYTVTIRTTKGDEYSLRDASLRPSATAEGLVAFRGCDLIAEIMVRNASGLPFSIDTLSLTP